VLQSFSRGDVQLLDQAVGAGKADEVFHAANLGLLGGPVGDRNTVVVDARRDGVEGVVVVDFPAQRGGVLGRSARQQEATGVVVEAKPHHIGQRLVEVHADGVTPEAPPVGEPLGLDHQVTEVHLSEHVRCHELANLVSGERKSLTSSLKSSARSHCIQ